MSRGVLFYTHSQKSTYAALRKFFKLLIRQLADSVPIAIGIKKFRALPKRFLEMPETR